LAVAGIILLVAYPPFIKWYNRPDPYSQYTVIFKFPDNGPLVPLLSDLIIRKDLTNPEYLYLYERYSPGLVRKYRLIYEDTISSSTFETEIMKKK
jgi:hypothetical protein